ncbi:TPA: glycosyltransferase domain-containing protein [Streptococcus suis]
MEKKDFINSADEALMLLNSEIKNLKSSKEYRRGVVVTRILDILYNWDIKKLQTFVSQKRISKKQKYLNKPNKPTITYNESVDVSQRIAVYTCVTGNYEFPVEPLYKPDNIDYYIVTDMDVPMSSKWQKIDINIFNEIKHLNQIEKSRFPKMLPHKIFKEYDYSIYIDGNVRVVADLSKFLRSFGRLPIASHWHPERNCIYKEAEACKIAKKASPESINLQIDKYNNMGMPKEFGLVECNVLVRAHHNVECKKIMESWWLEFLNESKRDQLSFPYVLWKNGYTMDDIGFLGIDIKNNSSLQLLSHGEVRKWQYI